MTEHAPDPGWYPDPGDPGRARYWDGAAWTDRSSDREAIGVDPAGPTGGDGGRPAAPWWRRPVVLLGAFLAVAAISVAAVLVTSGEAGAEVILEPTGSSGVDPFTASIASEQVEGFADAASAEQGVGLGEIADPRVAGAETSLAGRVVGGTAPGLYGGSRDTQVCATGQMIDFLGDPANRAEAEAWAGVFGISVDRIPAFVRDLTAVRLSFATRVTNHGFSDGAATPVQSLLQAGTAVLVDDTGAPAVKCDCGNPLLAPADLGGEGGDALDLVEHARNPDDAWDGLDAAEVVSVRPGGQPVDEITLNDLEGDGLLERPVGSDGASMPDTGTGDVRIKLEWASSADLDLHVSEPDGTEISYQAKGPTATGGQLDVDSNVSCNEDGSVENVFWPSGDGPAGTYEVEVVGFTVDGCGSGEFTLTIDVAGRESEVHTGAVGEDDSASFTFTVGSEGSEEGSEEPEPGDEEPGI